MRSRAEGRVVRIDLANDARRLYGKASPTGRGPWARPVDDDEEIAT
jgi:hypothetical protein